MYKMKKPLNQNRYISKICWATLLMSITIGITSCKKYLDVVPDNVSTIDNAFKLRLEAEKYLFTLYSYLPKSGDGWYNPGMTAADEIWYPQDDQAQWHAAFRIAEGQQNKAEPYFNDWTGANKGQNITTKPIWGGIRNCNVFLENLSDQSKVPDITAAERSRWIGEALFLKAFYHYYMLRMYGPIPLINTNVPVDADLAGAYVKRKPIDECVSTISNWFDEAAKLLPERIQDENTQMGRVTKPIALAMKAKLLMMAASPLFNGNSDFANFRDKEGTSLFNPSYNPQKWIIARDAVKAAIDAATNNGFGLYNYTNDGLGLSDTTRTQLSIRNAITKKYGVECIWGNAQSYFVNENLCMPPTEDNGVNGRGPGAGVWAPPIKVVKLFYTSNGIPIEEDKTLDFSRYNQLRTATDKERFYIKNGFTTARLNFDREPRFYADLGFDGSIWYMKDGNNRGSDEDNFYVKAKNGDKAGFGNDFRNWSETGYFIKKLVNWESTTNNNSVVWRQFPWPEVRTADLYLLYAEAENEVNGGSTLAIQYLDKIRSRAGLKGIVESWSAYSNNPTKYTTKEGLRAIIHRERAIEMMFEGQRFWDLRRWKEASEELQKDITGWNIIGKTDATYYQERFIFSQRFIAPRDYFWPIGNYDTRRNTNLVENPGW